MFFYYVEWVERKIAKMITSIAFVAFLMGCFLIYEYRQIQKYERLYAEGSRINGKVVGNRPSKDPKSDVREIEYRFFISRNYVGYAYADKHFDRHEEDTLEVVYLSHNPWVNYPTLLIPMKTDKAKMYAILLVISVCAAIVLFYIILRCYGILTRED